MIENPLKYSEYNTKTCFTWCTSCGNYSIWGALRNALVELGISPKSTLLVYDIGCNGNGAGKMNSFVFKGLHGRSIPLGAGASIANSDIKVIASIGDGGAIAEGIGHLIHAIRSNYNMTLIIHNNQNFALTTGQASPTTDYGIRMNSSPDGVISNPINIIEMLLPLKPAFLARGFSGDRKQLTSIMKEAILVKGFSIIEVLQTCPSYNKEFDESWYFKRIFDVKQITNYNKSDLHMAQQYSLDLQNKIATGVIYTNIDKIEFSNRLENRKTQTTQLVEEVQNYDVNNLLEEFL